MGTLTEDALATLASGALETLGMRHEDAIDAARILATGDLFGVHTHRVARLESYAERIRGGGAKAHPAIRVERVAPAIARLDGDDGVGPLVGTRALEEAMAMARESGTGDVFVRHSNHFGAIGLYNYLAAEQGFASIIGSNSSTTIAPHGGRDARVGNSPLGFGVPRPGGRPLILDMAMSVVARAKIRDAMKAGKPIPDTWATDREGRPTTDAKAALDGFLSPIGGYKGYGLALIVDLFAGLLSGAAYLTHVQTWIDAPDKPQDLGHFFFLIDTARLGSADWLAERMDDFAAILHSTLPADAAKPVLLPGEIEMEKLERHRRDGVAMDEDVIEMVERLARGA